MGFSVKLAEKVICFCHVGPLSETGLRRVNWKISALHHEHAPKLVVMTHVTNATHLVVPCHDRHNCGSFVIYSFFEGGKDLIYSRSIT
jgi:hypothetical protein